MDQEQFVNTIKEVVRNPSIDGVIQKLIKPPGRSPNIKLVELSQWYNQMENDQKIRIQQLIEMAVDESIFGFLCVLDGVRSVNETTGDTPGMFKLSFIKGDEEIFLNGPDKDYLHDIYNS